MEDIKKEKPDTSIEVKEHLTEDDKVRIPFDYMKEATKQMRSLSEILKEAGDLPDGYDVILTGELKTGAVLEISFYCTQNNIKEKIKHAREIMDEEMKV